MKMKDTAPVLIDSVKKISQGLRVSARAARTGVQEYAANEIGLIGDHMVNVYRPESAVFDRKSIEGYAGSPVTIGHPKNMVTPENWSDVAVGEVSQDIVRDGEFVRVTFTVRDQGAIDAINEGTRQISMGYETPIEMIDGVTADGASYQAVQTGPIEINHLAIVDEARGGKELRIGDGARNRGKAPNHRAVKKEDTMSDALKTIVVDGLSVQTTDAGAQAITKLQDELASVRETHDGEISEITKKLDDATTAIETKDGEIAALTKKLSDATSPKTLADMAKRRAAVVDMGKKSGMTEEEMEDMDEGEIKKKVVTKSMGKDAAAMSDAAIDGAFQVIAKDFKSVKGFFPAKSPLADGLRGDSATVFSDRVVNMSGVKLKKEG